MIASLYSDAFLGPPKGVLPIYSVPIAMDRFFLGKPRYRVAHGGRGSIKSWTIARALLFLATRKKLRILCAREYQKSIRESVHYLLKSQISLLGLDAVFDIRDAHIVCTLTGSEFIFAGLHHNVSSLKSMEAIDICWIEEAETVSIESWDTLDPTIRKPGSEIWISFNPKEETDPIYKMFVLNKMPNAVVVAVGWGDNPWLPKVLRQQAEWMRENDPERYDHIWGGKTWFQNDAQVLNRKWCVKDFDIHMTGRPNISGPNFGVDFGFSQDPGAAIKSYIEIMNPEDLGKTITVQGEQVRVPIHTTLYIAEEAFTVPGTPSAEIIELHKSYDTLSEFRQYTSIADNARPETISHLINQDGYVFMRACEKWAGCVEDGVTWLRGHDRIVIHPSCTNIAEEARLWSYKRDPLTQKPLRQLKPGWDHGWDAVRYGNEDHVTRTPTIFDVL